MTAAFTDTALKLLHCPYFLSSPLQQGYPKDSVKRITFFFPRTTFLDSPRSAHAFSNTVCGNLPSKQCLKDEALDEASKFQIITSMQCESGAILESCLKS